MKKNVLKKFAAAALAAATVMSSMSVMAFAADAETGTTEEKGSVTITKYMSTSGTGDTLSTENYTGAAPTGEEYKLLKNVEFAYVKVGERVQVDTATSDSSQTEIQYTVTDENFLDAIGIEKAEVNKNFTQKTLNEKVSSSANKTKVINFVNTYKGANKKSTGENGTASFTELDLNALYVFAETDATNAALASDGSKVNVTKVSVPFLVSLPFTGSDGTTVTNLKVYPKNSTGTESIDKNIIENNTKKKTTVANIGDTINYEVTYSVPVPENGLTELKIVDTMDKGLTFKNEASNITVINDKGAEGSEKKLTYNTEYTVSLDEAKNTVTIDFAKYLNSLQKNSTETFTITYTVKLNENAVLGQTGNKNKVYLEYQNYGEKEPKKTTDKDTTVFTYGIDLTKKGEGTDVLEGVKFELTDSENQPVKVQKNGTNEFYTPGGSSNEVTTDANEKIYIRGLKPGTYKLTETKTNAGYVLLKDPVVIEIKDDNATGDATADVGSKPVTMQADQINKTSATAEVPLTVVNSKGFNLPATGGRGIALFTIAGIAIVAAAGSLLFMRKRSK
ncbi:SpaH/EbpB family LPXTG-anchored major pilin [Mediterraneibacter faecis]|nr:SpaH/EbpB family LPXTG-anchored major pilin [Mediterraneibacter faecis]MCB5921436.1 SpaH/EbpB family LPXTG-anchored major pilin [Lachnospiraceae bacterium 210521-DFI.1.105]MCB6299567.1 SpaH/EbpB family LPXTG-anchored major pilin [Mediterraneibacter faecis]MCB6446363.1 SpaH/EbpB family LPXTG-anchored major pilin [Mediterraneibacter faecis]MCQ5258283.1 SpaH/EbpB family LPXTG-anchored major pilin [Mediterraneibacter faecis]MCQ5261339.1 SpaH/EbpB family LPXTG-anchored major pilin [Mediterraneib